MISVLCNSRRYKVATLFIPLGKCTSSTTSTSRALVYSRSPQDVWRCDLRSLQPPCALRHSQEPRGASQPSERRAAAASAAAARCPAELLELYRKEYLVRAVRPPLAEALKALGPVD